MQVVNPFDQHTHRNSEAPRIAQSVVERLARIGARIPFGEFAGQPQFRFEWGQSELAFRCGKMRLKYVDERIPAIETPNRYLWRQTSELDHLDRDTGLPVFKKEIIPVKEIPEVIPAGYFFQEDLPSLTWIGKQHYFIAQWKPPEMLGDEQTWEKNRFENWENPETGKIEWTDMTGPFPRSGRFEAIAAVAQSQTALFRKPNSFLEDKIALVEMEMLVYAEPMPEHVEEIERAWQERERGKFKTALELSREAFARDKEQRLAEQERMRIENRAITRDLAEHKKLKVYQQSPNLGKLPTRFGKGRRIK